MKTVAFCTLGCKVNQYETNAMEQAFIKAGYEILDFEKKADVYVGKNRLTIDERKAGNMLRTEIYDIAWVGVEIKGTKVNVKIVEKTLVDSQNDEKATGNIIANKSGVITKTPLSFFKIICSLFLPKTTL